MARRRREDGPDALHHVFNRGIARRTVFETREDVRYFQSRLARMHRKGILLTHAFCFLTNHFHLIVGSPTGELSRAIQLVVNPFVRWFNRKRRRDGSLFRGRFGSRRIRSRAELIRLIPYVDQNSEKAGLVNHAEHYPYGSARYYLGEKSPRWLSRSLVEGLVCGMSNTDRYSPDLYRVSLGRKLTPAEIEWLELRIRSGHEGPDPLDDLVGAAPDHVRDWMIRKANLADGTRPAIALVPPSAVLDALRDLHRAAPFPRLSPHGKERRLWPVLAAGLLREACGFSMRIIAAHLDQSLSSVAGANRLHRRLLSKDTQYAELAARVLVKAIDRTHVRRQDHSCDLRTNCSGTNVHSSHE